MTKFSPCTEMRNALVHIHNDMESLAELASNIRGSGDALREVVTNVDEGISNLFVYFKKIEIMEFAMDPTDKDPDRVVAGFLEAEFDLKNKKVLIGRMASIKGVKKLPRNWRHIAAVLPQEIPQWEGPHGEPRRCRFLD